MESPMNKRTINSAIFFTFACIGIISITHSYFAGIF